MKARVFLPAALSGVLLWTAFFPLDFGPMAYIALVPFLTLVRAEGIGRGRRYLAAYLGGLVFFLLALQWVRVAHPKMEQFAWPGMAAAGALYWPVALFLIRRLDRFGLPLAVTFPIVWVALEYFRAHMPTGFSALSYIGMQHLTGFGWYFLGHTQHHVLPLLQAADVGGVYVVSAAVATVNGAGYEWAIRSRAVRWLLHWPQPSGWTAPVRELWVTSGAIAVPLLLVCYGAVRLAHPPFGDGPRIAAIQGNLSQAQKSREHEESVPVPPLEDEYMPLAQRAVLGDHRGRPPDLVIWPETCYPDTWYDTTPELAADPSATQWQAIIARNQAGFLAQWKRKLPPANMLLGLNRIEWIGPEAHRKYNSAILVTTVGELAGRYDKMHLVPFGEYVPLRGWFPGLQSLTPYTHDYSCTPGTHRTRFVLSARGGTYRFGVLICYEDTDPSLARMYHPWANDGEGVDFLVNISNDGWFDGSEEHEQHLAICRFRAVEARRSVVRAVNMGVSAVIDPDGRVVVLPNEDGWAASKATRGIVRADVPLDHRGSLYAVVGDWFPALCWLGIAVGWVATRRKPPAVV